MIMMMMVNLLKTLPALLLYSMRTFARKKALGSKQQEKTDTVDNSFFPQLVFVFLVLFFSFKRNFSAFYKRKRENYPSYINLFKLQSTPSFADKANTDLGSQVIRLKSFMAMYVAEMCVQSTVNYSWEISQCAKKKAAVRIWLTRTGL